MGNIKHTERIHEHIHLMVQGKKKKSKCQDGKVACSKKIASRYDGDFWATTWFMIQYWFYGLSYITFSGPILAFTMPVPLTNTSRFGGEDASIVAKMWNWLSVATARMFMPYAWIFTGVFGGTYSELNIRNWDANTGALYFLLQWTFLPLTWVQASLGFVLTSPVYLILLPIWFIKWLV